MIKTNKNTARYSIAPTPVACRKQVIRSESGTVAATYTTNSIRAISVARSGAPDKSP